MEKLLQKDRWKRLVATCCFLLLLATMLLLSGCGGYNSPGSPKGTPTPGGGYGLVVHVGK